MSESTTLKPFFMRDTVGVFAQSAAVGSRMANAFFLWLHSSRVWLAPNYGQFRPRTIIGMRVAGIPHTHRDSDGIVEDRRIRGRFVDHVESVCDALEEARERPRVAARIDNAVRLRAADRPVESGLLALEKFGH